MIAVAVCGNSAPRRLKANTRLWLRLVSGQVPWTARGVHGLGTFSYVRDELFWIIGTYAAEYVVFDDIFVGNDVYHSFCARRIGGEWLVY